MGTISEKLVYLNGTKQAIKQAINEDFEVIDNNTTFREYAEEISSNNAKYKDLIPKETKNATNTLDISNSAGLDKALVTQYGNTYQETTTGNQLLDFSKYDSKSSPTMTLTFENDVLTTTCIASGPYMNFTWIITDLIKANPGKTLSFTFDKYDVSQATDSSVNLQIYTGSNVSYFALVRPDGTSVPYTIPEDVSNISTVNFRILPNNLATPKASTLVITKPMLQFGTDKLEYEEYSGGKPSPNPDYPQEIQVVTGDNTIKVEGKNLFNLKDTYYKRLDTGSVTINDNDIKVENVHTAAHQFVWWNIPIIVGDEITISYNSLTESTTNNNNGVFYTFNDEPYTSFVSFDNFFKVDKTNKYSTITATKEYLVIGLRNVPSCTNICSKLQVELGSTATTYEPYQGNTYNIDLPVENLFDKDNANVLNGNLVSSSSITSSVSNRIFYINCQPNTTYTVQKAVGNYFVLGTTSSTPTIGGSYSQKTMDNTATKISITTDANAKYLICWYWNNGDTLTEEQTKATIQVELGTKANKYQPYGTTPIELCKIGNYKDRIYPLNGKWYLEKQIGKVVFNGSEGWKRNSYADNYYRYVATFSDIITVTNDNRNILVNSDYFVGSSAVDTIITNPTKNMIAVISTNRLMVNTIDSNLFTVSNFDNWLSTHNTTVYYVLATPTTTEITESNYPTLYNQLNNIKLFEGVNHITMTNESGLDVEFDITYYKDWKLD